MQFEQSYDKVILTHDEIQEVLRQHILLKTGRRVRGDVVVNSQDANSGRGTVDVKQASCFKKVISTAYTYLEPIYLVEPA